MVEDHLMNKQQLLGIERAVKWFDNLSVTLLSSFLSSDPASTCSRFDRKEKKYNQINFRDIVCQYNKSMGGVDSHDQMLSYYRMSFRPKKYYTRLVFHLIDMIIVNSWNLFRRKEFKGKVAMTI